MEQCSERENQVLMTTTTARILLDAYPEHFVFSETEEMEVTGYPSRVCPARKGCQYLRSIERKAELLEKMSRADRHLRRRIRVSDRILTLPSDRYLQPLTPLTCSRNSLFHTHKS